MLSHSEAIRILELNQIKPKVIKLGSQNNIKAKLSNGYSFHIKPDESKPGHLLAYLNYEQSGVLITWNEINQKSLTLAIQNIKGLLDGGIEEANVSTGNVQEIESVQVNAQRETQLEQTNSHQITLEKRLLNQQRWFVPIIVLLFLLVGFGWFTVNRLIAACDRKPLEIESPQP